MGGERNLLPLHAVRTEGLFPFGTKVGFLADIPSMKTILTKKRRGRRNLPHFEEPGDIIFITITLLPGILLTDAEKDLIFTAIRFYDKKLYFLFCLVVMSTHTHFIFRMKSSMHKKQGHSMSEAIRKIKSYTTNQLKARFREEQHHWWLDDYFDKTIFDLESFRKVLEYIRMNPVKAHLNKNGGDYAWYYEIEFLDEVFKFKNLPGSNFGSEGTEPFGPDGGACLP